LLAFLQEIGATLFPDSVYEARLSQGRWQVWIHLETQADVQTLLQDMRPEDQQLVYARMIEVLGGEPQTSVLLDVSRTPHSSQLVAVLVRHFAQHWPCALSDLREGIYAAEAVPAWAERASRIGRLGGRMGTWRRLLPVLRPRISPEQATVIARTRSEAHSWTWLEPVAVQRTWRGWQVQTNVGSRGCTVWVEVDGQDGTVRQAAFWPR
jgi:hypothetical protein